MTNPSEAKSPPIQGRRIPAQERSRSRVDAILNAARELIRDKGTAGLKIQDLADVAGINPSSIYQYFPNKRAIIHALDQRYIEHTRGFLESRLQNIQSLEHGFQVLQTILDDYFEWFQQESVIMDLWYGKAADKVMQNMELQSSRDTAELIMAALSPYVAPEDRETLASYTLLLSHLTGSTVRLCLMAEEGEKEKLFTAFKGLLTAMSQVIKVK